MRTDLAVPFEEKDIASKLGARWDKFERVWYVPDGIDPAPFTAWFQGPPLLGIPGEDRAFGGNRLFVDLIPAKCWFTHARRCTSAKDWDRLRRFVYDRANRCCEICGEGTQRLDCHERWEFLPEFRIQRLRRLICICEPCHLATHIGYAGVSGERDRAYAHLKHVNKWNDDKAENHIDEAFERWNDRNQYAWQLDLQILTNAGVAIIKPVTKYERSSIAQRVLAKQYTPLPGKIRHLSVWLPQKFQLFASWLIHQYARATNGENSALERLVALTIQDLDSDADDSLLITMEQLRLVYDAAFWASCHPEEAPPFTATEQTAQLLEELQHLYLECCRELSG